MVSFNQIPVNIRVPGVYVEIDNSRALRGLFSIPVKILVIGQALAGTPGALGVPTPIVAPAQAAQLWGAGSMIAHMVAALRRANDYSEVLAIALADNGAAAAATATITFGGAVTAAGTYNLMIGGRRVQVGVASGASSATIAADVAAAVNADATLPVTASAAAGVVTLTARHEGECGNFIDVRHNHYDGERLPTGMTAAIAGMAGGTANPLVQPALDAIGDDWVTDIVTPYTDAANLAAVEAKLATNFGPLKMQDGHAWAGAAGTHSALSTLGDSRNSPHLTVMGAKGSPTPPWEWAAALAGVAAYHAAIDPARPLQTLELPGILAPKLADRFTLTERNLLLFDGISTFRVDAGGRVVIERAITTYKTNAFGAADASYLDVETLKTLSFLRFDLRNLIAVRYPRHKLANDGTAFARGQAVVTPRVLRAEIIARFRQWEEAGLAEGIDQFKEDLIVERDAADPNRVNALIPPDLVNQLRVFAGQIQFRL